MRNLKKFLAVLVVVAMMATSMMSAFAAADPALSPAEKAEGLGLLKGGADGKVDEAYLNLTTQRIQTAIIYLRLMGKEAEARAYTATTDNFADSNLVSGDAVNLLAYLRANPQLGWVGDGTNFNPLGEVSGQALYKVMLTAVGYTQGLDFDYADTIGFARAKGFSLAAYVGYADSVTNNGMAAAMIEALGTNMNGKTTTLAAKLVTDKVITEEAANKYTSYVAATPTPTLSPDKFAISSVASDNLKQVTVKFNMPVDATKGADKLNYTAKVGTTDKGVANVTLAADKMSAVILMTNAIAQLEKVTVTYAKAAISATATADATATSEAISDVTMPKVLSVVPTGNKLLVIKYSEPLSGADYLGNYTIDGTVYSALAPAISDDGLTVTLTLAQRMTAGTHKVVVSANVKDYALIPVAPVTTEITIATDTTAPAKVTLASATQTKVVVNFDKGIDTIESAKAAGLTGTVAVDGTDKTKVTVTFATPFLPAATSTLVFTNVMDLSGNTLATISVVVTPTVDVARPEFVSVTQKSANSFEVLYNKEVVTTSGTYTLKDKDGNQYTVAKSVAARVTGETSDNLKKVLITTTGNVDSTTAGPWSLKISGVTDNTPLLNVIVENTQSVTFADKTVPTLVSAAYPDAQHLYVTFSEKVDSATALTAAYYTLTSDTGVVTALHSSAALSLESDGKTVLITFSTDFNLTAATAAKVNVVSVKDVALNVVTPWNVPCVAVGTANIPSITAAYVTGTNTIKLAVSGATINSGTLVPYDFTIKNTNATADTIVATTATYDAAASTYNDNGFGVITLTTSQALDTNATYKGYSVVVGTAGTIATKSTVGVKMAANVGSIGAQDYAAPTYSSVEAAYSNNATNASATLVYIRVKVSEAMEAADYGNGNALGNNGEWTISIDGLSRTFTSVLNNGKEILFTINAASVNNKVYVLTYAPSANYLAVDATSRNASTNALKAFTATGNVLAP